MPPLSIFCTFFKCTTECPSILNKTLHTNFIPSHFCLRYAIQRHPVPLKIGSSYPTMILTIVQKMHLFTFWSCINHPVSNFSGRLVKMNDGPFFSQLVLWKKTIWIQIHDFQFFWALSMVCYMVTSV